MRAVMRGSLVPFQYGVMGGNHVRILSLSITNHQRFVAFPLVTHVTHEHHQTDHEGEELPKRPLRLAKSCRALMENCSRVENGGWRLRTSFKTRCLFSTSMQ